MRANTPTCDGDEVRRIPLSAISTAPEWWHDNNDGEYLDLDSLTLAIDQSPYGMHEPVVLRATESGTHYQVASGLRRVLAAGRLGLETVPARVLQLTEAEAAILTLSGKTTFRGLPPLRMAWIAQRILEHTGMRQRELAARLGVAESTVSGYCRLARQLPESEATALAGELGVDLAQVMQLPRRRLADVIGAATDEERRARVEELLESMRDGSAASLAASGTSPASPGAKKLHQAKCWWRRWMTRVRQYVGRLRQQVRTHRVRALARV